MYVLDCLLLALQESDCFIWIIFHGYFAALLTEEDKKRFDKVDTRKSHRITDGQIIMKLKDAAPLENGSGRRKASNWLREYLAKSYDFDATQIFPQDHEPPPPDTPPRPPRVMWLYGVKIIWAQENPAGTKITYRTFRG